MNKHAGLPVFLIALDGLGSIFVVLGVLGWLDVDIGLPVLAAIWPLLVIIGAAAMVPMIIWAVRRVQAEKQK